jgi:protein-S-isoprenylcysteine O-methyltransferase Ste14
MTIAVAVWFACLCVHFVLVPGCFVRRYRHSPYVWRWLPRNGYDFGEAAYGLLVIGYTVAILFYATSTESRWTAFALAFVIGGSGLILWAVATLGSNWRIGQDEGDRSCVYVIGGPYRLVRHPIYWGMAVSAFGQMLLTGGDIRGLILVAGTIGYVLFQSRAESRRWSNKKDNSA